MRDSEVKTLRGQIARFLEDLDKIKTKLSEDERREVLVLEGSLTTALKKLDLMSENFDLDRGGLKFFPTFPDGNINYIDDGENPFVRSVRELSSSGYRYAIDQPGSGAAWQTIVSNTTAFNVE